MGIPTSDIGTMPLTTTVPPFANRRERLSNVLSGSDTDGHDRRVGILPVGETTRYLGGLVHRGKCVRAPRLSAVSRLNSTGSTAMTFSVDADATDAHDDGGVSRPPVPMPVPGVVPVPLPAPR